MAVLDAALEQALRGRPRLVLVQGEPGIGKTRLLREFSESAEARARVTYARGRENLHIPLVLFNESLFPLLEGAPAALDLGSIRGTLAPQPGEEVDESRRVDAFTSASRETLRLARERPMVMCLDDLHWADRSSLELLEYLSFMAADVAQREEVPLLIVASHRPPEASSALAAALPRLYREEICQRIDLDRFEAVEIDALLRASGVLRPDPVLLAGVAEASQGNPFLVLEIADILRRRPTGAAGDVRVPGEFAAPTIARFRALPEAARGLLTTAAALGFSFSGRVLAAAAAMPATEVASLLEEAANEHLVTSEGAEYQFEHPLVRDAILQDLSPLRRSLQHAENAAKLEAYWGPAADDHALEIAHQLLQAGDEAGAPEVLRFGRIAGDQARAGFAWTDAARFYEAALKAGQATGTLQPAEAATLQYWCAFSLHGDGALDRAIEWYQRAADGFREAGDDAMVARALVEKLNAQLQPGGSGISADTRPLEELLATLADQPALEGQISAELAQTYLFTGNAVIAADLARRALVAAKQAADSTTSMYAEATLARHAHSQMNVNEAWAHWEQALEWSRRGPDRRRQSMPVQRAASTLLALGRLTDAEAMAHQGREMGRATGSYGGAALALQVLAGIAILRGELSQAEAFCREGNILINRSGYQWAVPATMGALVAARNLRGAAAQAEDAVNILLPGGRGARPIRALIACYRALAENTEPPRDPDMRLAWRGDMDYLPLFCASVEVLDLTGGDLSGGEGYRELRAAAEGGVLYTVGLPYLVPRILGLMAAGMDLYAEASAHFQQALDVADATGAPLETGRTYLDWARVLARRGDNDRALAMLSDALPILREAGARPLVALAESLEAKLGAKPATQAGPPPPAVDEADVTLIRQLAAGRSATEIAASMILQNETVQQALASINATAGIASPAQAQAYLDGRPLGTGAAAMERRHEIAVILFTDIVDSVQQTERLGDRASFELVDRLHASFRRLIAERGGRSVAGVLLGDGVLATFPSGEAALSAAIGIQQESRAQNVRVRVGLHAGDVIWDGSAISGGAVNIAARIRDACPPGQVIVSGTVRELAQTSAEVVFEDLGVHQLKGVAESRRLYSVAAVPVKAPDYPDRLSAREVEVLRLIARGRSNGEIATALVISPNTVLRHVSNILDKTATANRTEAAAYAVRHGLVEPPSSVQ